MDIPKKNIELENHAKCELLKAKLSSTFSYRRAFLLGRQDALKNMDSSSLIIESHFAFAEYLKDYDYVDNGSEGNEYLHAQGRFTEKEIYERWRDSL